MAGKILILGGGFGGVRAALDLEKKLGKKAEITLIDKNAHHVFVPALYETASAFLPGGKNGEILVDPFATKLKATVAIPFSEIFAGKGVKVVQSAVQSVDLLSKIVTTDTGNIFSYDYLVLGLGSDVADFGIPGVKDYALQFKTVQDAVLVNKQLQEFFICASKMEKEIPMKIFVVGAGFSGIELAAELALTARKIAARCKLDSAKAVQVYLFEAMPQILPNISVEERKLIRDRLTRLGVIIMENSAIESVGEGYIKLKSSKEFIGNMVVWTAGIMANHLLHLIDNLELSPRGKVIVDEYLRLPKHKNVFAVGDNIEFIDHATQKSIPSLAYLAINHGHVAAYNIMREIHGKELSIHRPFYGTWIAPIGGKWAVAHMSQGITVSGFMGWIVREIVDFRYFLSILPLYKAISFFFNEVKIFSKND